MTEQEVSHWYAIFKDPKRARDVSEDEVTDLCNRAWKTLGQLWRELFLTKEFEAVMRIKEEQPLIKVLMRCQKAYEAKATIKSIIGKELRRREMMKSLKAASDLMSSEEKTVSMADIKPVGK